VLAVTVKTPVREPACVGSKEILIEQLDLAATVLPQLLTEPKSPVLVATLETVMAEDPVLVKVTVCEAPTVPTY
jgi:hypothetical protein